MPEWQVLWYDSVEHHLHVVPHIGVPVLVDGQGRRRVEQLDVHQAHGELRQLRELNERGRRRKNRSFLLRVLLRRMPQH